MDGSMFNGVLRTLVIVIIVGAIVFSGVSAGVTYLIMKSRNEPVAANVSEAMAFCAERHLDCTIKEK